MFTSRADNRLLLRQDNAWERLALSDANVGAHGELSQHCTYAAALELHNCLWKERLQSCVRSWKEWASLLGDSFGAIQKRNGGQQMSAVEVMTQVFSAVSRGKGEKTFTTVGKDQFSGEDLLGFVGSIPHTWFNSEPPAELKDVSLSRTLVTLRNEAMYTGYFRQKTGELHSIEKASKLRLCLPGNFNGRELSFLSGEEREKLQLHNPQTVADAQRIPGMTPASLTRLLQFTTTIN